MNHHVTRALCVLCLVSVSAIAGPLEPPQGPVRSTMKPLDALEPRIALNDLMGDEGATVLVTAPGQYYLRGDLVGEPGKHGIRIVAGGDVRIDLNGFSLTGVPGSLNGIDMTRPAGAGASSLRVRCADGSCRSTISGWGGDGVRTENVIYCECTHLAVDNNRGNGITHLHGESIIHRDIATRSNDGHGVCVVTPPDLAPTQRVDHNWVGQKSRNNGRAGLHVTASKKGYDHYQARSDLSRNGEGGIVIVEDATLPDGLGVSQIALNDVSCSANTGDGVLISIPCASPTTITFEEVRCVDNTGDGLEIDAYGTAMPHFGSACAIRDCHFSSNGENGVRSENPLHTESTVCSENALYGARVSGGDESTQMLCGMTTHLISNGGGGALCGPGRFAGVALSVSDNGGPGIEVRGGCLLLTDSSVTNNQAQGVLVDGTLNVVSSNFRRNRGSGGECINGQCVMEDAVSEFNGTEPETDAGFLFTDVSSVIMRRCVARENAGDGVRASSGVGPIRWMSPEMLSARNTRNGISLSNCAGAVLERCVTSGNTGIGMFLDASCTDGRIERCTSTNDGGGGIWVTGAGHLVLGCQATENAQGAFFFGADVIAAPQITGQQIVSNRNADANIVY